MAERAIEPDHIEPAGASQRNAKRKVPPASVIRFVDHAEGLEALGSELVGKEDGKRPPNPIRQSALGLGANRAVFEMLNRIPVNGRTAIGKLVDEHERHGGYGEEGGYESSQRFMSAPWPCPGAHGLALAAQ